MLNKPRKLFSYALYMYERRTGIKCVFLNTPLIDWKLLTTGHTIVSSVFLHGYPPFVSISQYVIPKSLGTSDALLAWIPSDISSILIVPVALLYTTSKVKFISLAFNKSWILDAKLKPL